MTEHAHAHPLVRQNSVCSQVRPLRPTPASHCILKDEALKFQQRMWEMHHGEEMRAPKDDRMMVAGSDEGSENLHLAPRILEKRLIADNCTGNSLAAQLAHAVRKMLTRPPIKRKCSGCLQEIAKKGC